MENTSLYSDAYWRANVKICGYDPDQIIAVDGEVVYYKTDSNIKGTTRTSINLLKCDELEDRAVRITSEEERCHAKDE